MTKADDIRILLVDDDPNMRMVMQKIIAKEDGFCVVGEAENGQQAVEIFSKERPDVLFLDVEMPTMTGIECAKAIQDIAPHTVMIFATAHDDYMSDAFEVYAFDYMVKPFKLERVHKTLMRVKEMFRSKNEVQQETITIPTKPKMLDGKLMFKQRSGMHFLNLKDIILVQREDRATVIYTKDEGRYVANDSLAEMEARLNEDYFFRCHKSYIINLNNIKDITPYGRWTYVVRLHGTEHDALITHERYEQLQEMFQ